MESRLSFTRYLPDMQLTITINSKVNNNKGAGKVDMAGKISACQREGPWLDPGFAEI